MDLIGRKLGNYRVTGVVGRGGMAEVYEAQDERLNRTVALKIVQEPDAGRGTLTRFKHEAQIIAQLEHPNIVPVFDFGEEENLVYFVSPLIRGETLSKRIRRGPVALAETNAVLSQVAAALDYAHTRDVIHRDVKPANIMIEAEGRVRLMDFGIAQTMEHQELHQPGFTMGTMLYMAPEAIRGEPVDYTVDTYSLGVIAFEMLAGVHPFFHASSAEGTLLTSIVEGNCERLQNLVSGLPKGTAEAIHKAFAAQPRERFIFCYEFIAAAFPAAEMPVPGTTTAPLPVPASGEEPGETSAEADARLDDPEQFLVSVLLESESGPSASEAAPTPSGWPAAGFVPFAAGTQLAREPERVPPSPAARQAEPEMAEEATVMFLTSPANTPAAVVPPASKPGAITGEFTTVFAVSPPAGKKFEAPAELPFPEVALTVTSCSEHMCLGRESNIDHFPYRIGRSEGDLLLPFDRAISTSHAEIDFQNGGFTIRDLGSSNGTFVGGKRLPAGRIEPLLFGARISLGSDTQLTFGSNDLSEIPDLTGTVINDKYTLIETLHSSAKSAVYAASDRFLPRTVTVKLLSPKLTRYPGYREQFTRDARTAGRLHHQNICRVIEFGETSLPMGRALFVCMDYLKGGSLSRRIARKERFDIRTVAVWVDRICEALAYVHEQGIVHSSIKPSAIIFDSQGNPCLSDFAVSTSPGDDPRIIVGGPAFLAPEQWEGLPATPATDQYALAVVVYAVLTGELPHEGQEHPEIRKRNFLRGPFPAHEMAALRGLPPFPPEISQVLNRAMSSDPAHRFPGVQEFAAAFRAGLSPAREPATGPVRVFISYSRELSSAWALLLKRDLEREHAYEVFVDTMQQDTHGNFARKIERNIARAEVFVCLLAAQTLESNWVRKEIEVACQLQKPMIPVFQESFRHPADLSAALPYVQELLLCDGVHILDERNIFIDAALKMLADCIRQSAVR